MSYSIFPPLGKHLEIIFGQDICIPKVAEFSLSGCPLAGMKNNTRIPQLWLLWATHSLWGEGTLFPILGELQMIFQRSFQFCVIGLVRTSIIQQRVNRIEATHSEAVQIAEAALVPPQICRRQAEALLSSS